ncbi:MAG: lipoprotein LpqH [Mycobacterium sp.]|nr:lipoprotein LpqH [Mycobacterium sp.]
MQPPNQWGYAPGRPGNAQVTQSGNTYTITGTIPPIDSDGLPSGSPVPFEVDANCS